MVLELRVVDRAKILEPPDAEIMRLAHDDVPIAVEVQIVQKEVRSWQRIPFPTFREAVLMEFPCSHFTFNGRLVPAMRNQDVKATIAVEVAMPQTVIVLEGSILVGIPGLAEWVKAPLLFGLTTQRQWTEPQLRVGAED